MMSGALGETTVATELRILRAFFWTPIDQTDMVGVQVLATSIGHLHWNVRWQIVLTNLTATG